MLMFRFFVPLFFGRSFNFQSCQDVLLMLLVDPECSWWKDCRTSSYSTTQHANVMYSFGVFQNSADSSRVEFWTIISKECLRGEIAAFFCISYRWITTLIKWIYDSTCKKYQYTRSGMAQIYIIEMRTTTVKKNLNACGHTKTIFFR